jgi:hypothetical protein
MTAIFISVVALLVSAFAVFVNAEKLRLDLYNKRFDIYMRTLRFYHVLLAPEEACKDGSFFIRRADFIMACRESRFLFDNTSGVYALLHDLNTASFKITGFREHGKEELASDADTLIKFSKEVGEALALWNISFDRLEHSMAPYLNFHYTSILSPLVDRVKLWRQQKGPTQADG